MGIFLYQLFRFAYHVGIHIASLWNAKAKLWVKGRMHWRRELKAWRKTLPEGTGVIWMHCASLGEFEQGRPLLEKMAVDYPTHKILLTFFSPSGYEVRKNYAGAHFISYLPMDAPHHASQFIRIAQPSLALWVKYEYWYYFLRTLYRRNIPLLLVSGIFRPDQPFFNWYGKFWRRMLGFFTQLFVQDERSLALLQSIGVRHKVILAGDTRFDRVSAISDQWQSPAAFLSNFCLGHRVIVVGSSWEDDEALFIHYVRIHPEYRFIFAPHEVSPERIAEMKEDFPNAFLYSEAAKEFSIESNVLFIDCIGILSRLYKFADITYIGGGFNSSGIHNTLEAAVYGKPVVFGPVYEKFSEAVSLVDNGAAFSVENAIELESTLDDLFANDEKLKEAGEAAAAYVKAQQGATAKIVNYVAENRLLIN